MSDLVTSVSPAPESLVPAEVNALIDQTELAMLTHFQSVDVPVEHTFTPGLYTRTVRPKAGTLISTKIHKKEHPFVVSAGRVGVWTHENGLVEIKAPYVGVTKPGTRRVCFVFEDTVWTTFHATPLTDLDEIEADIIEQHVNPLLAPLENPLLTETIT